MQGKNLTPTQQRLYLQIADKLAEQIENDGLTIGERLPAERELAQKYQVSRQTVREALIALEVSKMVEIRPGSGVYVTQPQNAEPAKLVGDVPGPLELMEARICLEGEAAELAAARISNEELQTLNMYLKQMSSLVEKGEAALAEKVDGQFHQVIASATRNDAINSMINWLWTLRNNSEISMVFAKKLRKYGMNPSIEQHIEIYNALAQRDGKKAKKAMQSHLEQVSKEYINLLSEE